VKVGGAGPDPTRTISRCRPPTLPTISRTCTLRVVSPVPNAKVVGACKQNCTCVPAVRNAALPNWSKVQAKPGDVATAKLHAKSLSASATVCDGPKSGGFTAGTPPSHTAGLPSPSRLLLSICRSGRRAGFCGSGEITIPGGKPLCPAAASTTTLKPKPALRKKTGAPSTWPSGFNRVPLELANPKVTCGPGGTGVGGGGSRICRSAIMSVPSVEPSSLMSVELQSGGESPKMAPVSTPRSRTFTALSQLRSPFGCALARPNAETSTTASKASVSSRAHRQLVRHPLAAAAMPVLKRRRKVSDGSPTHNEARATESRPRRRGVPERWNVDHAAPAVSIALGL